MEHKPIDDLAGLAEVVEVGVRLNRAERIGRWRELLLAEPDRPLRPLRNLEFKPAAERARSRADQSPLAVAFADPTLRAAGLGGDTVGQAQAFFGLSDRQAHYLLCDCRYMGSMKAGGVARRLDAVSHPNPLVRAWMMLRTP